jgi:D-alanyl-lipoteichoic acid acyltransferase DltB (MBOAT superfamily)
MTTLGDTASLLPSSLPTEAGKGTARRVTAGVIRNPEVVSLRQFATILAQLSLLLLIVSQFRIESDAFFRLAALTVAGFTVHYFLPLPKRLPFFVLLSLAGIAMILGLVQGAWLIAVGLCLIGICHLPLPFMARAGILVSVGAGLALPRWGLGQVPWSEAVWPILGSMFVFRLIIYMYDRKHAPGPTNIWQTLGYFFLLPNVCFPLFPVVDYRKFTRNYYDDERHKIYQVGVEWMWRGIMQLVLYRMVYQHLTIDSVAVSNLQDLFVYMLSTFLLYVRISGHFHLVIGMLHLFGFNLPETHHRYFLASSFTDFWRRINIYWKDFMLKVFYYPAYFKLRKLGDLQALIIATAFTFAVTWFLHLVQWFWIRGSIHLEANDIIFWSIFGLLVMVNSIYETRRPPARSLTRRLTPGASAGLVLQTLGTFTVICILWSFWTAESASDWMLMIQGSLALPPWQPWQFAALAAGSVLTFGLLVYAVWKGNGGATQGTAIRVPPATVFATSLLLCVMSIPAVAAQIGQADLVQSLQSTALNRRDAEEFQRGYYENLLDVSRFNRELARVYEGMPADFVRSLATAGLARSTEDEQDYELIPNREGRFVGEMVRTNRWGMRDRDYTLTPIPGTYRIALIGPSTAMGSGVKQDESFEAIVEERLNDAASATGRPPVEILNFGVAGYSPFHMLYQLDRKVAAFQPDMALFLGHVMDVERASRQFIKMAQRGTVPEDPYLRGLIERTGIRVGTGANEARRRIRGYERELLHWVYATFIERCRALQIVPVFVYMQAVTDIDETWRAADRLEVLAIAGEAGFPVLDLTGAYGGHPASALWIAENDGHPNALGNRLLADRLHALLQQASPQLGMPVIN